MRKKAELIGTACFLFPGLFLMAFGLTTADSFYLSLGSFWILMGCLLSLDRRISREIGEVRKEIVRLRLNLKQSIENPR